MLEAVVLEIAKVGRDHSGTLIALALLYLGLKVGGLKDSVDGVRKTIGEKVFPEINSLQKRVSRIEGRMELDRDDD